MSRRRHSYPLCHRSEPASLRHALGEVDSYLGVDHTPVLPPAGPLLRDIHHGQIQHFQQAVIGGKHGFGFGHLAQLAVETLNGVGGVNQPPHLPKRVVKDFLIKFTKKSQTSAFLSLGRVYFSRRMGYNISRDKENLSSKE